MRNQKVIDENEKGGKLLHQKKNELNKQDTGNSQKAITYIATPTPKREKKTLPTVLPYHLPLRDKRRNLYRTIPLRVYKRRHRRSVPESGYKWDSHTQEPTPTLPHHKQVVCTHLRH